MPISTGILRQERTRAASPGRAGSARRLRSAAVEWVVDRLSDRDWQLIEATNRLRLVSGKQLERLYFYGLHGHTQEVVRGRVLHRLVDWRVLTAMPRRVGGAARGSARSVFALGGVGARLWAERQTATMVHPRVRHPEPPTERTVRHTLAVSELYADLVEQSRALDARVLTFEAEPASWWPNDQGGYLKPDAYALLTQGNIRERWWIEVDQATESLPTIKRKLSAYLDFVARGQFGPHGVVPRVLISGVSDVRCAALHGVVTRLPAPATALFLVAHQREAACSILGSLHE